MKIWEAACATAATTTSFRPFDITQDRRAQTFGKTPLRWNNPVWLVYREAQELWPDGRCLMLSIGTGDAPKGETDLAAIAKEAEKVATEFSSNHETMVYRHHLFRFNVIEGMDKIGPTELREKAELSRTVDAYFNSSAVEPVFEICIKLLKSEGATQGKRFSRMFPGKSNAKKTVKIYRSF